MRIKALFDKDDHYRASMEVPEGDVLFDIEEGDKVYELDVRDDLLLNGTSYDIEGEIRRCRGERAETG